MGILATCPACGFPSAEVRCPRCYTLKVVGCSGSCLACKSSCDDGSCALPPGPAAPARSREAASTPEPAEPASPDAQADPQPRER